MKNELEQIGIENAKKNLTMLAKGLASRYHNLTDEYSVKALESGMKDTDSYNLAIMYESAYNFVKLAISKINELAP